MPSATPSLALQSSVPRILLTLLDVSIPCHVKTSHMEMGWLWFAPYRLDGICPLDEIAVERRSCQGGRGIATFDTGGPSLEVEHEIGIPIVIDILDVPCVVSLLRALGAEANSQRIDGSGIKAVCGQDSHRDHPVALGVDGVGGVAGLDVQTHLDDRRFGLEDLERRDITAKTRVPSAGHIHPPVDDAYLPQTGHGLSGWAIQLAIRRQSDRTLLRFAREAS